jgi:SAM-dependent methyltransferase
MREDFYAEYFRVEDRHWWFIGRRRIVLSMLSTHFSPGHDPATTRILDMGCGTGTMLTHLRQFGDAQGVDADEQAVGFCHARGETRVQQLESDTLPFADDSFDLVTALDVLEHIEDDGAALREVVRVLRPGGTFLATVPAHPWMWGAQDEVSHHFRRYGARELRERIRESGLRLERLTYFNTILFPPIAAIRLGRRLVPPRGREVRSDFGIAAAGPLNRVLARAFGSEARWLSRSDLPFGISLLALTRSGETARG